MEQGQACWKRGALATDEDALGSVILLLSCQLCWSITARALLVYHCPSCRPACVPACLSVFTPVTVLSSSMWDFDENSNICPQGPLKVCPSQAGLGTLRKEKGDPDLLCGSRAAGGLQGHSRRCKSGKSGKRRYGTVRRGMDPITQGVALSAE